MRTPGEDCLVIPVWHAVHHGSLSNAPPGRLQVYGFGIKSASSIGQRLLSEIKRSRHEKPNLLRREIGLVSAQGLRSTYAKAYLSCLEWDISAPLFPSYL